MELIYKSNTVDIFFDTKRNILVQKWREKVNLEEIDLDNLSYSLDEIIKIQLYESPERDIEDELKIMLFQSYPQYDARA
jgi:hypothetical protein